MRGGKQACQQQNFSRCRRHIKGSKKLLSPVSAFIFSFKKKINGLEPGRWIILTKKSHFSWYMRYEEERLDQFSVAWLVPRRRQRD